MPALKVLQALCQTLEAIPSTCSEKSVAEAKFTWWQAELKRMMRGEAGHPLTKAFMPVIHALSIPESLFENKLYGVWMDLQYQGYETEADFAIYQRYVAGSMGALQAYLLGFNNPASLVWAEAVMQSLYRIEWLQNMGKQVREGRIYVPKTRLAAHGVSETELLSLKTSPNFVALCTQIGEEACITLNTLLSTLPPEDWATFRPFRIQIALSLALLKVLERYHFPVLSQKDTLTPLKRSWITLKTF